MGDIYISAPQVLLQSKKYNIPFYLRLGELGVHGICHLLGYDHEYEREKERMEKREDEILERVCDLMKPWPMPTAPFEKLDAKTDQS